jgi:hypothetical protein
VNPLPRRVGWAFQLLFLFQPIALFDQAIHLGQHPLQEGFGGGGRDTGSLELKNFLPLAGDLHPHMLDFRACESRREKPKNVNKLATFS